MRKEQWRREQRQGRAQRHLLVFSALVMTLPLAAYFGSLRWLFGAGQDVYAAALAVVVANVILVGYVVLAFLDDDHDSNSGHELKTRKEKMDVKDQSGSSSPLYALQEDAVAIQNSYRRTKSGHGSDASARELLYVDEDKLD
jgi:hypothetical protein